MPSGYSRAATVTWSISRLMFMKRNMRKGNSFHSICGPAVMKPGAWKYTDLMGRALNKSRFEEWKTIFYKLEGWNTKTGWPKRSTLEKMDLKFVADALQTAHRLGEEEA